MANEKNTATMQATATEAVEKLLIERETYKGKDGKDYWSYFMRGKVRNRDVKVDFAARDQGGYEVLDIVFDGAETAELIMHDEEMTDDSGKSTKYTVYEVQNVDADGTVYSCKVKPQRDSDKSLLTMILNQKNRGKAV